jgi:hypothetical protein
MDPDNPMSLPMRTYTLYWMWRDARSVRRDTFVAYSVQNACHKLTERHVRSAEEMTDVIVIDAVCDDGPVSQKHKETPR